MPSREVPFPYLLPLTLLLLIEVPTPRYLPKLEYLPCGRGRAFLQKIVVFIFPARPSPHLLLPPQIRPFPLLLGTPSAVPLSRVRVETADAIDY